MTESPQDIADAIQAGDTAKVAALIAAGADVNGKSEGGWAFLTLAAMSGQVDSVRQMLSAGARPNTFDYDDPLYWASRDGVEIVQLLIEAGARVSYVDPFGIGFPTCTALHRAAESGNVEIIRLLLRSNARDFFETYNELSWSPLHCAAKEGHLDAVRVLLHAGADPNTYDENNCGDPALKLAISYGKLDVARALLNAGADPTRKGWMGVDSLYEAERQNTPESRELLAAFRAAASRQGESCGDS